jgi:beta-1,4-mannosyltransferase
MRTTIVVLEDLGLSPRMQAHALALAAKGGDVMLVGLEGAPLQAAVTAEPRVRTARLPDRLFARRATGGPFRFVWQSFVRAAVHAFRLAPILLRGPRPDLVLVQNPPAVPALAVVWLAARLRRARLAIDWHNLSHQQLAVRLGDSHRAVRAVKRSERRWARRADAHLAVSHAMAAWLKQECGVVATVFHDRPAGFFRKPDLPAATGAWQKLARELALGERRVPLVVCSTSWAPSEDFDLLLEALERTERRLVQAKGPGVERQPDLLLLMTGRGPLRSEFEARVRRRPFVRVAVRMLWLEPADYPIVIGIADAGLCLHQSSSGRDLPIRLAEFRGVGVPLCVYDYGPVVAEVLTSGREGVVFHEPGELAAVLSALATADLSAVPAFRDSREWLVAHPAERWDEHWTAAVEPVLVPPARLTKDATAES